MNRKDQLAHTDARLQDAEVLTDAFAGFDSGAFLDRIAHRAKNRGSGSRAGGDPEDVGADRFGGVPRYRQAAARLETLSSKVVTTPDTVEAMTRFDNAPRIDPASALTFACLLYLSDCPEGAQFWWQFAVGAGVPTAAYCL